MSETKIFRKKDLDLEPVNGMKTIGLVNVSFSDKLGAGIGVFEDCSIPWHITYDEVINILEDNSLYKSVTKYSKPVLETCYGCHVIQILFI